MSRFWGSVRWRSHVASHSKEMNRRGKQRRKAHKTRKWNEYVAAERRHLLIGARQAYKHRPEDAPLIRVQLQDELRVRIGNI